MNNTCKLITILSAALITLGGCNKFVDTPLPADRIPVSGAFSNDASATNVLLSGYGALQNIMLGQTLYTDLFSDEVYAPNAGGATQEAQENTYTDATNYDFYEQHYKVIFIANTVLEALAGENQLTPATVQQLRGEALFLRAYSHFQLLNLYGTPPLITTTQVAISSLVPNTPAADTRQQIITDLGDALDLVSEEYPSGDRTRANKAVVRAFLARAYLYFGNWAKAEEMASDIIQPENYTLVSDLTKVFVSDSPEIIWQLWSQTGYTAQGINYIPEDGVSVYYRLRDGLVDAFEAGDGRRANWIKMGNENAYYPYKYRLRTIVSGSTEYAVQLRLAEQYLIRAEARAQQNNVADGLDDLNAIRFRAGLEDAEAATKEVLLEKIEQERRIELMTEVGHRWFDLKRTGRSHFWLSAQKPTWQQRDTILPYPVRVLLNSPELEQNDGY